MVILAVGSSERGRTKSALALYVEALVYNKLAAPNLSVEMSISPRKTRPRRETWKRGNLPTEHDKTRIRGFQTHITRCALRTSSAGPSQSLPGLPQQLMATLAGSGTPSPETTSTMPYPWATGVSAPWPTGTSARSASPSTRIPSGVAGSRTA